MVSYFLSSVIKSGSQTLRTAWIWFLFHPLERKLFYQKQTVSHLWSANSCWTCQVLIASKIKAFKSKPKEIRSCECMWLKLVKNLRSSIKNQLILFNSALNVDKKWSKNHDDMMRPCRIIVPQSSKKSADISILSALYTAITLLGCIVT